MALEAEIEAEVVTLSVRVASVSARVVKEEPGAVGRSGFLGNSLRVSSELVVKTLLIFSAGDGGFGTLTSSSPGDF